MTDGGVMAARDGAPYHVQPLDDAYNEAAYKQLLISLMRDYYNANPEKDKHTYLIMEQRANKARYTDLSVRNMTDFSRNIMFASDLESIAVRRRENYNYLYSRLQGHSGITIGSKPLDTEGKYVPFGLFLLVENRDSFYDYLVGKGIIGEIQWVLPLDYYTPGEDAVYLSDHNLMIHCDQRYTQEEMCYVADSILSFFGA
jgi:dTDP-4-amino-4,6-dideoxygalactose transaminase